MKIKSTTAKNATFNRTNDEAIVKEWLETTADFYINYNKLTTCIREKTALENISLIMYSYIGQAAVKEIVELIRLMEVELEILLIDMDCLDAVDPLNTEKEYRKLACHTHHLKRLNQQANSVLLQAILTRKNCKNEVLNRSN